MLTISTAAFDALSTTTDEQLVAKLSGFLAQSLPTIADETHAAIAVQVRSMVAEARQRGFRTPQGIVTFVVTAALLGSDFVEQFTGARQIIESEVPEDEKQVLLGAFTTNLFKTLESE